MRDLVVSACWSLHNQLGMDTLNTGSKLLVRHLIYVAIRKLPHVRALYLSHQIGTPSSSPERRAWACIMMLRQCKASCEPLSRIQQMHVQPLINSFVNPLRRSMCQALLIVHLQILWALHLLIGLLSSQDWLLQPCYGTTRVQGEV